MKKVNCVYCGNETDLPFACNYCSDEFCAEHRLPEEHRCVKLTSIRAKRFDEKKIIRKKAGFFNKVFGKLKG